MPIKYTSKHTCEKCNKTFEWIYFEKIRTNINKEKTIAEIIPDLKDIPYYIRKNIDGKYDVRMNCPHCGWDNWFTENISDADINLK